MSKKSKRQIRRDTSSVVSPTFTPVTSTSRPTDFNPDYSHVISDLKRIGTLAGGFLVILIALSFFLK